MKSGLGAKRQAFHPGNVRFVMSVRNQSDAVKRPWSWGVSLGWRNQVWRVSRWSAFKVMRLDDITSGGLLVEEDA